MLVARSGRCWCWGFGPIREVWQSLSILVLGHLVCGSPGPFLAFCRLGLWKRTREARLVKEGKRKNGETLSIFHVKVARFGLKEGRELFVLWVVAQWRPPGLSPLSRGTLLIDFCPAWSWDLKGRHRRPSVSVMVEPPAIGTGAYRRSPDPLSSARRVWTVWRLCRRGREARLVVEESRGNGNTGEGCQFLAKS